MKKVRLFQMLIVISLGLNASHSLASLFIYQASSDYSTSNDRDKSTSKGFYLDGTLAEIAYEKTDITLTDNGGTTQFHNFTGVWKPYSNMHQQLRLGLHYTNTNERASNGKYTFIGEALNYAQNVYGSALYYTHYANNGVDVWQLSPRFGRYYWPRFLSGTLYLQAQIDAISLTSNIESRDYLSLDLKSHWRIDAWAVELGGWLGKQRSAVTSRGFTVYNLDDLYEGEARIITTYHHDNNFSLSLAGHLTKRIADNHDHTVASWMIGLGYSFE